MIGISSSSRSFASLGRYLVVGRDNVEQGRVSWTSGRNLPTDEPELAAKIMRATAVQNVRVTQPVYHIALSFDPGDRVSRETMERVADNVLRELKLDRHQAIIVAHEDRAHPHVHILVNRIHPETGRAWDRWQDYPAVQRVLRAEERTLNLRSVPASVDLSRDPKHRADEVAVTARERTERDRQQSSAPPRNASRIDADLAALERVQRSAEDRFAAERVLAAAESRRNQLDASLAREAQARTAFASCLERAYVDPEAAANAFLRAAEQEGERRAAARMRESPEAFGQLIGSKRDFRRNVTRAPESPREAAREAAGHGASVVAAHREIRSVVAGSEKIAAMAEWSPVDTAVAKNMVQAQVDAARSSLAGQRDSEKAGPRREQIELRLGKVLRRLAPPEFEALRATLSPERFSIAHKLRRMVRDAVLGRDVE